MGKLFRDLPAEVQTEIINSKTHEYMEEYWETYVHELIDSVATAIGIDLEHQANGSIRVYFSGFYSQGDGSSFFGAFNVEQMANAVSACRLEFGENHTDILELAEMAQKLYLTLLSFEFQQRCSPPKDFEEKFVFLGADAYHDVRVSMKSYFLYDIRYYPFDADEFPCHDDFLAFAKAFNGWIYRVLREEYEYLTSEEYVRLNLMEDNELKFDEYGDPV
jgi:hypothetical protein